MRSSDRRPRTSRGFHGFGVLALSLLSCLGCTTSEPKPQSSKPAEPRVTVEPERVFWADPETPLSVLLITVDGLRADMPWTGYERDIAPWLTKFSKRSVSYSRAYALSSSAPRSIGALLTGHYPSEMPRNGEFYTTFFPENQFLAETLQGAGHATLAGHVHGYFREDTGITQGFAQVERIEGAPEGNQSPTAPSSEQLTQLAEAMLGRFASRSKDETFFAHFHYVDPHEPYLEHANRPSFGPKPRDAYDQEVHYTDEWVGKLVDFALKQPFGERLAVIITAGHGESFATHHHHKYGHELWEDQVRVPLLIYAPKIDARTIDEPRSHIDLAPTVLELMGAPVAEDLPGQSLVPELYGLAPEARPVIIDLPRGLREDRRRALVKGDQKVIAFQDDNAYVLYNVAKDPEEKRNLAKLKPDELREIVSEYKRVSETIGFEQLRGDPTPPNGRPGAATRPVRRGRPTPARQTAGDKGATADPQPSGVGAESSGAATKAEPAEKPATSDAPTPSDAPATPQTVSEPAAPSEPIE